MAPRREHGLQADRGHVACVVAPHLAQASDALSPDGLTDLLGDMLR